jgi:hypothetical protein
MQKGGAVSLLEIVVHCFAEKIPDFASMLTAQLSSIVRHQPSTGKVLVSVCMTSTDRLTYDVVQSMAYKARTSTVQIRTWPFEKSLLFRRAIGRNYLARRGVADVVWFADCDYMVGPRTLDAILAVECDTLWHPRQVDIHVSHEEGDQFLERIVPGEIVEGNYGRFQTQRVKFAIGGLQFVPGSIARAKGYLDQTRWTKPVDPAGGFRNTAEDKVYRGSFARSEAVEIPNLSRLRHSRSAFEDAAKRLAQTAGK